MYEVDVNSLSANIKLVVSLDFSGVSSSLDGK